MARWLHSRFGSFSAALLTLGWLLLAVWAAGLVIAAIELGSWRQELSRTLLQLNADAQFRARAHTREAVDPEWYRRKALALLSATQRLQHDESWTLFVPGSWRTFDNLEEQIQARLEREFSDIVVETMRRELYARASKLTGVPMHRASGELQTGAECQSPVPQNLDRRMTVAAEDLPEFVAVADYVKAVQGLDDAVQSFLSLQYSGGQPDQLRKLVAYTLDQQLPGTLAGAVGMFNAGEEVKLQPALMQTRLQWATRCALGKAMSALHTRLLNTNDLFALEQGLVERSAGLFEPTARPVAFDRTLERYRAVHTLLEDQHALLSKGHNDWMGQGTLQLGPAYQQVLSRIARTRLLGPEVVQQLQNQSGEAFAEFRRQFELTFSSRGEPGIVWLEGEKRFGLSPDRSALRQGLDALLKTSFMAEDPEAHATRNARESASLAKVVQEARALAAEHDRAMEEIVPTFPREAQPVVQRVVDARVSEMVYQRAYRTLKAALPTDPRSPLDPAAFRQQREQVLALQAVLKDTGGSALGDKLVATIDGELTRRLAGLREEWMQQPLHAARADDFAWWEGDPMSLAQTLGAGENAAAPSLARTAARLATLVQQAKALSGLGGPGLTGDGGTIRWRELQAEVERYNTHAADSSLLRLERYLTTLGPDFKRENCVERLAVAQPVTVHEDDIAQRHVQVHQALAKRCQELRAVPALPLVPAASLGAQ